MAEGTGPGGNALRRMVRAAPAAPGPGGAEGRLREAAPRALDRHAGLRARAAGCALRVLGRSEMLAAIPEGALRLRVAVQADAAPGPPPGAPGDGIAWLDAPLFAAIVERRLTGAEGTGPVEARPPTALDAVLCGEVVDALCAALVGGAAAAAGAPRAAGFLAPGRDAAVLLPDLPFEVHELALEIGAGRVPGRIGLARPAAAAPGAAADAPPPPPSEHLLATRAELRAVLGRITVPFARLASLAPGETLTLPRAAIDGVTLASAGGRPFARGRLGRMNEHRAVRVAMPLSPAALAARTESEDRAERQVLERLMPE